MSRKTMRIGACTAPLAGTVALALTLGLLTAHAQTRRVQDTFTATTTGMTPDGLMLKIDVLEWSDDAARAAVIAALTREAGGEDGGDGGENDNVSSRLTELPTVGVVWRSGAAVGHSLKFAHRETLADGGERLTFVTDKPLDAYSFEPWTATGSASEARPAGERLPYSVIELQLTDTGGAGSISLAADVEIDPESRTISLEPDDAPRLLTAVKREPKPYWAQDG